MFLFILYFRFVHQQFDAKGRNFLHSAILVGNVETVLFLIGVSANVTSRIQDSTHRTPLHLAVEMGSEIIVRHLVRQPFVYISRNGLEKVKAPAVRWDMNAIRGLPCQTSLMCLTYFIPYMIVYLLSIYLITIITISLYSISL